MLGLERPQPTQEAAIANFKRLSRPIGGEVFINIELVAYVTAGRNEVGTLIHFAPEGSGCLVEGTPRDVMDVLWPATEHPRRF
jgi:hypothetical protein